MKYLKTFENTIEYPNVGDYVLIKSRISNIAKDEKLKKISNFIDTTIGTVSKINDDFVMVYYEYIPNDISTYFLNKHGYHTRLFDLSRIVEFDSDIEMLKFKIKSKKYNI